MLRAYEDTWRVQPGKLPNMRRRYTITAVLLSLLGLMLIFASAAGAQDAGAVVGQVVNGTRIAKAGTSSDQGEVATSPVGEGSPVRLRVMRGGTELDVLETTTDADGRFRFDGLATDAGLEYWPEVTYLGVRYPSAEPLRFDAELADLPVTLTVFETTDDDSAIRLDSVHMIAESFGQVMRITEIHLFGNSGDRTYVGPKGSAAVSTTVLIPLPDQAIGLALEQESTPDQFVQGEGGLRGTQPVPPGEGTSIAFFSYHLPVDGQIVPLERKFAYPVVALNLLAAQPGLTVRSSQLQSRGLQSFQGRQFEFYATEDIAPDSPLNLEFMAVAQPQAALPGSQEAPGAAANSAALANSSRGDQGLLRWLGYALSLLAVVGAIAYALVGHKSSSNEQRRSVGRTAR